MARAVIHTSDRIMFKRCRRKWDLGSLMRRGLEPIKVNDKLWLGTGVHHALKCYYGEGENPVQAFLNWADEEVERIREENQGLWDEQEAMLQEQIELSKGMLEHYMIWAPKHDNFEVIHVEKDFVVPIRTPKGNRAMADYVGRFDGIVRDEHGLYWLLEHKTVSNRFDVEKLPLDEQCGSYIWAAQQIYGIKLEGVIYNMLRKKVPRKPEVLKRGGLSKNKNIDTTLEVYVQALVDYYGSKDNVPWQEYTDILQTLKDKGNTFFHREKVRRSQKEIENLAEQIYWEYREMTSPKLVIYPNPTRDCSWDCDFRSVCLAMNDGSDYEYMLESMFRRRGEVSPYEGTED